MRGAVGPKLRIDATLIANTSWLRVVLWAFLFALREEGVEQIGSDPFPLLVFDDPQSTFDSDHRHRWAQYVASGVAGRQAMIAGVGPDLGYVGYLRVNHSTANGQKRKRLIHRRQVANTLAPLEFMRKGC